MSLSKFKAYEDNRNDCRSNLGLFCGVLQDYKRIREQEAGKTQFRKHDHKQFKLPRGNRIHG